MIADYRELEAKLASRLAGESLAHCRRTAAAALRLAEIHSADKARAKIAGLLHDVARDLSNEELLRAAAAYNMSISPVEEKKPYLLHAAVGVRILREEFEIDDEAVLRAVERHTFGGPGMSILDKIVYLADVIEPERDFDGVEKVRRAAEHNLDQAFALAYQGQLLFIISRGGYLHPRTLTVWNEIASEVAKFG